MSGVFVGNIMIDGSGIMLLMSSSQYQMGNLVAVQLDMFLKVQ